MTQKGMGAIILIILGLLIAAGGASGLYFFKTAQLKKEAHIITSDSLPGTINSSPSSVLSLPSPSAVSSPSASLALLPGVTKLEIPAGWSVIKEDYFNFSIAHPDFIVPGEYTFLEGRDSKSINDQNISVRIDNWYVDKRTIDEIFASGEISDVKKIRVGENIFLFSKYTSEYFDQIYYYVTIKNNQHMRFVVKFETQTEAAEPNVFAMINTLDVINKQENFDNQIFEVEGVVNKMEGNCMPTMCDGLNCGQSSCKSSNPVSKIYVFAPVDDAQIINSYFQNPPTPLYTTTTDSKGRFKLNFKTGTYSIMAEDNGKPYCNLFSGFACSFTFYKDKPEPLEIKIDHAVY